MTYDYDENRFVGEIAYFDEVRSIMQEAREEARAIEDAFEDKAREVIELLAVTIWRKASFVYGLGFIQELADLITEYFNEIAELRSLYL